MSPSDASRTDRWKQDIWIHWTWQFYFLIPGSTKTWRHGVVSFIAKKGENMRKSLHPKASKSQSWGCAGAFPRFLFCDSSNTLPWLSWVFGSPHPWPGWLGWKFCRAMVDQKISEAWDCLLPYFLFLQPLLGLSRGCFFNPTTCSTIDSGASRHRLGLYCLSLFAKKNSRLCGGVMRPCFGSDNHACSEVPLALWFAPWHDRIAR